MNTEYIKDYLWSTDLENIDNAALSRNCIKIESYLIKTLNLTKADDKVKSPYRNSTVGENFNAYNIFTYPDFHLLHLFKNIKKSVAPLLDPHTPYMIQGWMNVYRNNGFIDWHAHWLAKYKAFHGFYCVNTENVSSFTEYKFTDLGDEVTTVPSKNGRLVFGRSDNDLHRSSPWNFVFPRITIAFDIVPVSSLSTSINHFIPFL